MLIDLIIISSFIPFITFVVWIFNKKYSLYILRRHIIFLNDERLSKELIEMIYRRVDIIKRLKIKQLQEKENNIKKKIDFINSLYIKTEKIETITNKIKANRT